MVIYQGFAEEELPGAMYPIVPTSEKLSNSEIRDMRLHVGVQEDVLRLDVSMNYSRITVIMEIF
ncbi:hypothetical protein QQP08_020457 [Theobroma cacao]|nr:hypothetical protein QQP08_020457 [Theobroma cacao]